MPQSAAAPPRPYASVAAPPPGANIWKERRDFYEAAIPRDTDEEEKMLAAALRLSELQAQEEKLQFELLSELTCHTLNDILLVNTFFLNVRYLSQIDTSDMCKDVPDMD